MRQEMYKLENGSAVRYNGQGVIKDGLVYTNPSIDILRDVGYRPMGQPEMPEFDVLTETVRVDHYKFNEDESEIIAVYVVEKLPADEYEENTPTVEERLTALEQAGLERDAALIELAAMLAGGDV